MNARVHVASRPAVAAVGLDPDTDIDLAAMRVLLQRLLPGFADGGLRIDGLSVSKARRSSSLRRNPCPITLCFELQVSDLARGQVGTQTLYAKVFRPGLAEPFFRQQDRSRLARPAFGEALVHVAELNMVIWALPNDPGLPQLVPLLDPVQAERALPWAAMAVSPGVERSEFSALRAELLRYEPEQRATLRYTLTRADGGAAQVLYGKTFRGSQARDLEHRFDYFWQLSLTDPNAPRVAQPLGHSADTQTLWQAAAAGTPLLQSLAAHDAAALMRRAARALALLHAAPLAPSANAKTRSAAHWLAEARRRQTKISRAHPALAARAARVVTLIAAQVEHQAKRPLSLIHGDFHPEQIWVHEGRIVLFDFDEFTLGDPMEDLATFMLKLEQAGVAPELVSALVDEYAASAPRRFDARSLRWHLAVQSLVQASRAFVFQKPGWAIELGHRLAGAEARAAALDPESTA